MSDVAAVLLSIGEPYRERARESIAGQSLPVDEVVEVDGVSPFSRALNEGARRVTAPFFIQVDADMILDRDCVEVLRAAMGDDTGLVVGDLTDELVGRVVGVKLFRTECVHRVPFGDTISPDTDFGAAIARAGWRTRYEGRPAPGATEGGRTFGEHRPDYTPAYTYRKHLLEGRRYWHRGAPHGLRSRYALLESSRHPLAPLAHLAVGHGLFMPTGSDELLPLQADPRADWLASLLRTDHQDDSAVASLFPIDRDARVEGAYRAFLAAGRQLGASGAGATVLATIAALAGAGNGTHALVAKVALAHGLLGDDAGAGQAAADERLLERFVMLGLGRDAGALDLARASVRRMVDRVRARGRGARW